MHPDAALLRLAARQHQVFTRGQALECGLTPRMILGRVRLGLWVVHHSGVYGLAGTRTKWLSQVMAACLATDGFASSRSAARLWGVKGFGRSSIEVAVHSGQHRVRPGITVHQLRGIARGDVVKVDAIPITSVARTLIDLAGTLQPAHLRDVVDDVLARQLVTLHLLERRLAIIGSHGQRGVGALREIVAGHDPATAASRSHAEPPFLRLFRRLGFHDVVPQFPVVLADGTTIHVDFADPGRRIAIEIWSRTWHGGRTEADLERENALVAIGWVPVQFVKADLRRPEYVRSILEGVIEQTG